jgi:8-oxo-dGTP pyrophosphatase MutT (NUDIX family)
MTRELIEETGVTPKVGRLLFIQQLKDDDADYTEFFFHIENPEDFEEIDLESTSHGVLEVAEYDFIDPKTSYVLPAFLSEIDIQSYIDEVKPVYMHSEL